MWLLDILIMLIIENLSEIRAGKMTEQQALDEIAKADPRIIPYIKPYLIGKGFAEEEDDGIKL